MTESNTTTITLTETGAPSRSKGRGWLRIDDTFATTTGRQLATTVGATLTAHIGADIRRASGRTDKERSSVTITVTGNPDDVVTMSIGSPQSYDATIRGAVRS